MLLSLDPWASELKAECVAKECQHQYSVLPTHCTHRLLWCCLQQRSTSYTGSFLTPDTFCIKLWEHKELPQKSKTFLTEAASAWNKILYQIVSSIWFSFRHCCGLSFHPEPVQEQQEFHWMYVWHRRGAFQQWLEKLKAISFICTGGLTNISPR